MRNHLSFTAFRTLRLSRSLSTTCETARTRSPFGPNGTAKRAKRHPQTTEMAASNGPFRTGFLTGTHRFPLRKRPFSAQETSIFPKRTDRKKYQFLTQLTLVYNTF